MQSIYTVAEAAAAEFGASLVLRAFLKYGRYSAAKIARDGKFAAIFDCGLEFNSIQLDFTDRLQIFKSSIEHQSLS